MQAQHPHPQQQQQPRVEVCEEPTMKMGGPTYKQVQPKTYKVLQQELAPAQPSQGRSLCSLHQASCHKFDKTNSVQLSKLVLKQKF